VLQTASTLAIAQAGSIRIWDNIIPSDNLPAVKDIADDEYKKLQSLLRAVRTEAGVTQLELAAKLGVPQSVVSKYESGERRLDIVELRLVCHALGLPLVDFVRRLEKEAR
jgi:ribosome-binding protein aMBF1 (putative translation factor)